MKTLKKLFCMLMTALLLLFLGNAVLADYVAGESEYFEDNGITITYTEEYENLKGTLYPYPQGVDYSGYGLFPVYYFAMSEDEFYELMTKTEDEMTEADKLSIRNNQGLLTVITSIDGNRGVPELTALFEKDMGITGLKEERLVEISRAEDTTFYLLDTSAFDFDEEAFLAGIAPVYKEEFVALKEIFAETLRNAEYYPPVVQEADKIGTVIQFDTYDLDGNPVESEDLFKDHDLTMVNVWATWCHNCIGEMTGLGELARKLAEKNVAVVGVCMNADDAYDACLEILKEHNVNYLNLLPIYDLDEIIGWDGALPTTYFFDSKGTLLTRAFRGAPNDMDTYVKIIDSLLSGEQVEMEQPEAPHVAANGAGVYRVIVSDSDGNLVKGVTVQFCTDTLCMMSKTNENGVATFEGEEGTIYTAHILKVPAGYQKNNREFNTNGSFCDIYVSLDKE